MQIINLYAKELRPRLIFLSFSTLIISSVLLILLFIGIAIYSNYSVEKYNKSLMEIERIQFSKEKNIIILNSILNPDESEKKITALRDELSENNETIARLNQVDQYLSYSYAEILSSISKNIQPKIYLNSIVIKNGVGSIVIYGKSKNIEDITYYIHKLKKDKSFNGSDIVLISADKDEDEYYNFKIGNGIDKKYK